MTILLLLIIAVLALGFSHIVLLSRVHAAQKALTDEVARLKSEVRKLG